MSEWLTDAVGVIFAIMPHTLQSLPTQERGYRYVYMMAWSTVVAVARAGVVIIPGEAHGHVARLSCSLGEIEVSAATYGG